MSLRLLYVFPEPLPLAKARSIQAIHTVHALAQQGVEVVLAYVPVKGSPDPFPHYGLSRPENLRLLPLSRRLPWPLHGLRTHSNKLFTHRLAAWLRQHRRGEEPQIVMARHLKLADELLNRFPRLPLLYETHEIFAENAPPAKQAALREMEKAVLSKAPGVIAITAGLAKLVQERYGLQRTIEVVPSSTALPTAESSKDWDRSGLHIVYTGSLYEWKGVQDLIAAAAWLPGCKITVVGGEPERIRELGKAAPKDGAEIQFTGHVSHAHATAQLGQACIAVLPNRQGSVSAFTSPLKLFEYMAAGCAVVATDLPVFREILEDNEARWVAAGDPRSLADGIRTLVDNPALARELGGLAAQKAKLYTWEARASRLIQIMENIPHAH